MKRLTRSQWQWTLAAFALYTVLGLLSFGYHYLDDLANNHTGTLPRRLIEESTGVYAALVMVPFVVWMTQRFPITRTRWTTGVIAWLGGAVIYTLVHTTLMAVSRAAIYHAFAMGSYDYGIMLYRYPMEGSNDVVSYFAIATIAQFIARMDAARKAEVRAAELQTKLAQAQLQNLRLQLHPHFLFNTLNAISSVMYEDVRKADEMLAKLSDFLRLLLASSDVQQVPIDEELALERMYVEIMTTRLERGLTLNVRVEDGARGALVPFMLLQPLLENSIRHGMGAGRVALDLSVDVRRNDGSTIVLVTDDGVGIPAQPARGLGLRNVESRLRHVYGSEASFTIEPRPAGGTQARMIFPYSAGASA